MDLEDIWGWLGFAAIAIAMIMIVIFIFAPKNVDYYYLTTSQSTGVTCVEQHWTWEADSHAFCTDDVNKALDVLNKVNSTIKK